MPAEHQLQLDPARERYAKERRAHANSVAIQLDNWTGWGKLYHQLLAVAYGSLVVPGQRILEIGCGLGDLINSLKPTVGIGIDFSEEMLVRARTRHPDLKFVLADAHDFELKETFDVVILSDLVNDAFDVQQILRQVRLHCHSRTRVILNLHSRLWQAALNAAQRLGLAKPFLPQNWLTVDDIDGLMQLENLEIVRKWTEVLLPLSFPLITGLANKFAVRLWPLSQLALSNFIVARPLNLSNSTPENEPKVSVVIPARNEAGNIRAALERLPEMGRGTEIIFVEGHSQDGTFETIKEEMALHPERSSMVLQQTGTGKGNAVREGLAAATGDILMILDSDLTVPPEDLPRFYDALRSRKGEFINGVRLVYPMEQGAMQLLNEMGNKLFGLLFSWLLGQPIRDTLCGTKALWREDYEWIVANRSHFGDFDPFGDFDLLFGAARLNLKIVGLPIRYRERVYGTTNIRRWIHGWLLIRMVGVAARRLKFV